MRSIVRLVLSLFLCSAGHVLAQVQPPAVRPVFHGTLQLLPASGRIDRKTGSTTLVVSRWTFIPNPDSNGMHPEPRYAELVPGIFFGMTTYAGMVGSRC